MAATFFESAIIDPVNQLRTPLGNPNAGFTAQVWHFTKAEVVARVVGVFASVIALFEAVAQLLFRDFRGAAWFAGVTLVGSLVGFLQPGRLWMLNYPYPAAPPAAQPPVPNNPVAGLAAALGQALVPANNAAALQANQQGVAVVNLPVAMVNAARQALGANAQVGPGTPLHDLIKQADLTPEAIIPLLTGDNQALVNVPDRNGRTVLFREIRASQPRPVIITTLLDHGANYEPNQQEVTAANVDDIWTQANQPGIALRGLLMHHRTNDQAFIFLQTKADVHSDRGAYSILLDYSEQHLKVVVAAFSNLPQLNSIRDPIGIIVSYLMHNLSSAEIAQIKKHHHQLRVKAGMAK